MLIIWDKMFGSFVEEDPEVPCEYGLVTPIHTHNPLKLTFHEWIAMFRDVARPQTFRSRLGQLFGPPERTHSEQPSMRPEPTTVHADAERLSGLTPPTA